MISLETIMEEVSSLGPNWTWLLRSTHPDERKPGKFLVNLVFERTGINPKFFPVFGDNITETFNESLRRARAFKERGLQ